MISRMADLAGKFGATLLRLPQVCGLIWTAARGWALLWLFLLFAQGLLPAVCVYLTKTLVDHLVEALRVERNWAHWQPAVSAAAWLALTMILTEILRCLTGLAHAAQSERLRHHIADLIQRQSVALDYAFYERADFYDHLHQARSEAAYRPVTLLENLGSLFRESLTLLAMMGVLLPFAWWLPLVLLLSTLPALGIVLHYTLRQYEWQRRTVAERRRANYYDQLLTTGESAAEIRIFNLGEHFRRAYRRQSLKLSRAKWQLAKEQSLAELSGGLLALLTTGLVLAWMGRRALQGAISTNRRAPWIRGPRTPGSNASARSWPDAPCCSSLIDSPPPCMPISFILWSAGESSNLARIENCWRMTVCTRSPGANRRMERRCAPRDK